MVTIKPKNRPNKQLRKGNNLTIQYEILWIIIYYGFFLGFWWLIVTGDPKVGSHNSRAYARLGVYLGINHQPSPEEQFWVHLGATVIAILAIVYTIAKRKYEVRQIENLMTESDWDIYRCALRNKDSLFAETEMLVRDKKKRFIRIPYTNVREIHLTILSPKKNTHLPPNHDEMRVVYEENGEMRSMDFLVYKFNHAPVIAARIAAVNQLEIVRSAKKVDT